MSTQLVTQYCKLDSSDFALQILYISGMLVHLPVSITEPCMHVNKINEQSCGMFSMEI